MMTPHFVANCCFAVPMRIALLFALAWLGEPAFSASQTPDSVEFFESKIRPVLVNACYECHSAGADEIQGDFALDSRQALLEGGPSGPAVTPGDADASLLLSVLRYEDLEMPPDEQLPADVIADFEAWVAAGAVDPREEQPSVVRTEKRPAADADFWSYRRPVAEPTPHLSDDAWSSSDVDAFLLTKIRESGLSPVSAAGPVDLLRRLHLDLTGLPPRVEQTYRAEEDFGSPDGMLRQADRLLASPAFGEHWGRRWLDVARYAESAGGGRSRLWPDAWRYRNYVVDAVNDDLPYDQFLTEQIAGDLLPWMTVEQRRRQLIATGYVALGPKNLDQQDKELLTMNSVDEQIDSLGRGLLGLSLGCARCHDHKFDAVPTADYYALAGVFRSTEAIAHANISDLVRRPLPVDPLTAAVLDENAQATKLVEQRIKKIEKDPVEEDAEALAFWKKELKRLQAAAPPSRPRAEHVIDAVTPADCAIRLRGQVRSLGEVTPRGFIAAISRGDMSPQPAIPANQSGRLQLAEWIACRDNPLTARVMANRIWAGVFGVGLVRTTDDFGYQGERPSHPELLDRLSVQFTADGWSTKRLVRRLVASSAYRLSNTGDSGEEVDPQARLRWRATRKRLSAEALRDAMLAVAGRLDRTIPERTPKLEELQTSQLRALYLPSYREEGRNDLLAAFDAADPSMVVGARSESNVPPQALFLLNSPWVQEQATAAARRLLAEYAGASPKQRLEIAFRRTLGRPPRSDEAQLLSAYLHEPQSQPEVEAAYAAVFQSLFACVDFRYLR